MKFLQENQLKWLALVALIIQNSGLALAMRYTFVFPSAEGRYVSSTAVLLAEVLKLIISSCLFYMEDCEWSFEKVVEAFKGETLGDRMDWLKLTVPSVLYSVQNTLQYFSMSQLSAPVFQVLYQMKIVTTAIFSVIILQRRITGLQWLSIMALSLGVALVQLSQMKSSGDQKANTLAGFVSVILGCMTSGFSGVYFEMVLKSSKASIWARNIQLSSIAIFFCSLSCYYGDGETILKKGFLFGYNEIVWAVIVLQAAGGLIVAVVVKYADNVLKGFATSLSIILSCVISASLFADIDIRPSFLTGSSVVLASVFLFGYSSGGGVARPQIFLPTSK